MARTPRRRASVSTRWSLGGQLQEAPRSTPRTVRSRPPTRDRASSTRTEYRACSAAAHARPDIPAPITITSTEAGDTEEAILKTLALG